MADVAQPASRIIDKGDGDVLVDSTGSLLVDDAAVIAKMTDTTGESRQAVAVELSGRVSHTTDRAYVLALFDPSSLPTLVGLLVEAMVEQKPALASGMSQVVQTLLKEWEDA